MGDMPIVRQVDHIIIGADAPEALCSLLSEKLQLPKVMPFIPYGMGGKGAVSTGNVCFEIFSPISPPSEPRPARIVGFAFEPLPLVESLTELDRRGIAHGGPEPTHSPDGELLWTNVMLSELTEGWVSMSDFTQYTGPRDRGLNVFLCEYHALDHWGVRTWAPSHRPTLLDQLRSREGGPVGLLAAKEITVGVSDYSDAIARWGRLLAPAPSLGEGAWAVGDGPAIRLVPSTDTAILSLTFAVESLDRARMFLASKDMLGESSEHQVTISPSKVQGLDLRLVQQ